MNIFKTIEPYTGTRNRVEAKANKDISVNVVKGTTGAIDNISFSLKNGSYERISDSDHIGFEIFEILRKAVLLSNSSMVEYGNSSE